MSGDGDNLAIARLESGSTGHNTVDIPTVEVFFQKSVGWNQGDNRGIEGISFEVRHGENIVQSGETGEDGRILVRMNSGSAELRLLNNGVAIARYTINQRIDPLEADTEISGAQRRLRTLGYHLGHAGDDSDGIDGDVGRKTDKTIQDFQIDNNLAFDGVAGNRTRSTLNEAVGGSAES